MEASLQTKRSNLILGKPRYAALWGGKVTMLGTLICTLLLIPITAIADSVDTTTQEQLIIQIEKTHQTLQGHEECFSISKSAGWPQWAGFNFLIQYDPAVLEFISGQAGPLVAGLDWERFDCRAVDVGNAGDNENPGFVVVHARLGTPRRGQPYEAISPDSGELCELHFLVSNDRAYECDFYPIRFVWRDCGDNLFHSARGDTFYLSGQVIDHPPENNEPGQALDITDSDCEGGGTLFRGGPCQRCSKGNSIAVQRNLVFINGGVGVACADSIDRRGEITGGFENPFQEVVLFINYLLYGDVLLPEFEFGRVEPDINNDGLPLTIGDLIYRLRIIWGDALPYPKLTPLSDTVQVRIINNILTTDCRDSIGGVFAVFESSDSTDSVTILLENQMEVLQHWSDDVLRVVTYPGFRKMTNFIAPGRPKLFEIPKGATLMSIQVCDYDGNMMIVEVQE